MDASIVSPRKLIEVALPLDDINVACGREKSLRHGHPSTLHLWWARRPLAAARAIIFAQTVNDPAGLWEAQNPGKAPSPQQKGLFTRRRNDLFQIIKQLVIWENSNREDILRKAWLEIDRSWREVCELNKNHPQAATLFNPERVPALHDPFAGGGSIPLEAQRLGFVASAADLNPVAVLINKAMIEIPGRFSGRAPVSRGVSTKGTMEANFASGVSAPKGGWIGARGLAEDVRFYGEWLHQEAERRIGSFYPKFEITDGLVFTRPDLAGLLGQRLTVIAWLWARTVRSPHPAYCDKEVPLVSNFVLSQKPGKESYVKPIVEDSGYRFDVRRAPPPEEAFSGTKVSGKGTGFTCILSGVPISPRYIKSEAQAGRMGAKLMAIVLEGPKGRVYVPPCPDHEKVAKSAAPSWKPEAPLVGKCRDQMPLYGMETFGDLFSPRQLLALTTYTDLIEEVREQVVIDAVASGMSEDSCGLSAGGRGARAYAEAISTYLSFGVSRSADFWSSLCIWANQPKNELVTHLFGRQAIAMSWDFGEVNPFSGSGGNFRKNLNYVVLGVEVLAGTAASEVFQADAASGQHVEGKIVSTDPPYFDNVGYADLSDYFYVWLRRSLRTVFPSEFSTMSVPKAEELVASAKRHGSKLGAESFFLHGMKKAMAHLAEKSHPAFPLTVYYAFKQSETKGSEGTTNTGWATFLEALIQAGFTICGTWPLRTERKGRMVGNRTNALASSIVLVCRRRSPYAEQVSRRDFLRQLNEVLPTALEEMTTGTGQDQQAVAPVDLSQAMIGPGMAVFSKYKSVLEADGSSMSVKTALQIINRFLADDDFDADTQFCLRWFDEHGWREGSFGDADVLARSKTTSVDGLAEAGVVLSGEGVVRLLRWSDYPVNWNPKKDTRVPIWEALHQLISALRRSGEVAAGELLSSLTDKLDATRQLAYRLYTLCERRGWAEDARAYNELITSWPAIEAEASSSAQISSQIDLFGG